MGGGGTGAPTAMNQLWGGPACKRLRTPGLESLFSYPRQQWNRKCPRKVSETMPQLLTLNAHSLGTGPITIQDREGEQLSSSTDLHHIIFTPRPRQEVNEEDASIVSRVTLKIITLTAIDVEAVSIYLLAVEQGQ